MKTLTVYSTAMCTHCKSAKQFLNELAIPYNEVNLNEDAAAMDFVRSRGHRSVPQIYVGETQFVAGWAELSRMTKESILERLQEE